MAAALQRRDDAAQASAEVMGLLVVVGLLIGGLATTDPGGQIARSAIAQVCQIIGQDCSQPVAQADGNGNADSSPTEAEGGREGGESDTAPGQDEGRSVAPDVALATLRTLAGDPQAVNDYLDGLDDATIGALIDADPRLLGNTDGVPPQARYAANDAAIALDVERIQQEIDDLRNDRPYVDNPIFNDSVGEQIERREALVATLQGLQGSDAQVLAYEPGPPGRELDGRLTQVFGDLETADHIGFVVPGIGNDLGNFGNVASDATNIRGAALTADGDADVAVIAHLGYDTPGARSPDALSQANANESVADGVLFGQGIDAINPHAHVTALGHSYGSLTVATWVDNGLEVDQVVLYGSPGTGDVASADQLGVEDVYVGVADGDRIPQVGGLAHGPNPADEEYGATVFETGTAEGHSQYTQPGTTSVDNLGLIVLNRDDDVVLADDGGR